MFILSCWTSGLLELKGRDGALVAGAVLGAAGRWCLVQAAGALAPLDGLAVPQYSFPCAASAWSGGALPPESCAGRRPEAGRLEAEAGSWTVVGRGSQRIGKGASGVQRQGGSEFLSLPSLLGFFFVELDP